MQQPGERPMAPVVHRVYDSDDSMHMSEHDGPAGTETDQGARAASDGPAQGFREVVRRRRGCSHDIQGQRTLFNISRPFRPK
eukprot:604593-Lingulodinium_polyedra.AAC.1